MLAGMERFALIVLLSLTAIVPSWSTDARAPKTDDGKLKRVYSVTDVIVRTLESFPEQLQIEALGETRTGGWTGPQLREIKEAGKAGLLTLEFVAVPPEGISSQAITSVRATLTMIKPAGYKGVRVISETNAKAAK